MRARVSVSVYTLQVQLLLPPPQFLYVYLLSLRLGLQPGVWVGGMVMCGCVRVWVGGVDLRDRDMFESDTYS